MCCFCVCVIECCITRKGYLATFEWNGFTVSVSISVIQGGIAATSSSWIYRMTRTRQNRGECWFSGLWVLFTVVITWINNNNNKLDLITVWNKLYDCTCDYTYRCIYVKDSDKDWIYGTFEYYWKLWIVMCVSNIPHLLFYCFRISSITVWLAVVFLVILF